MSKGLLPKDHWLLSKTMDDKIKRMILYRYDVAFITSACNLSRKEVFKVADDNDLKVRDRLALDDPGYSKFKRSTENKNQSM